MMSYRFFKMAVIESEIYFRFRFWWWYSFGKIEIYWRTKFRWDISIHGRDKTTSAFGKRTSAILDFYFRFLFLLNFRHRCLILHWPTIFRQNWTTLGGIMTSYRFFSRWRPGAILDLIWITLDHPQSAIVGLRLVFKFGLDRIHSFGDMVILYFAVLAWNCLFTSIFFWGGGREEGLEHISPRWGHPSS